MRIYLIGFMGSGKTALGKKLANHLHYPFYDIDERFENQFKITINDFFAKYGEEAFRKLEKKLLQQSLEMETAVISTGGGTPCFYDNMDFINKNGISVFINLPLAMAAHRLKHAKKPRPLLANLAAEEFTDFLQNLYYKRLPFYQMAHLSIDETAMDAKQLSILLHEKINETGNQVKTGL